MMWKIQQGSAGNARRCHPGRQSLSLFHSGNRAEVFIWRLISSPLTEDLGWKNPDLGNRATPLSHIKISSKILQSNSGKARKPGSCEEALIWLTKPGSSSAEKTPQSLHCTSSNCLLPASRLVTVPFSALGMIRSIYRNSLFFHTAT